MSPSDRKLGGSRNENISHIPFDQAARNTSVYEDFLRKASRHSRVIAICATTTIVRKDQERIFSLYELLDITKVFSGM